MSGDLIAAGLWLFLLGLVVGSELQVIRHRGEQEAARQKPLSLDPESVVAFEV